MDCATRKWRRMFCVAAASAPTASTALAVTATCTPRTAPRADAGGCNETAGRKGGIVRRRVHGEQRLQFDYAAHEFHRTPGGCLAPQRPHAFAPTVGAGAASHEVELDGNQPHRRGAGAVGVSVRRAVEQPRAGPRLPNTPPPAARASVAAPAFRDTDVARNRLALPQSASTAKLSARNARLGSNTTSGSPSALIGRESGWSGVATRRSTRMSLPGPQARDVDAAAPEHRRAPPPLPSGAAPRSGRHTGGPPSRPTPSKPAAGAEMSNSGIRAQSPFKPLRRSAAPQPRYPAPAHRTTEKAERVARGLLQSRLTEMFGVGPSRAAEEPHHRHREQRAPGSRQASTPATKSRVVLAAVAKRVRAGVLSGVPCPFVAKRRGVRHRGRMAPGSGFGSVAILRAPPRLLRA